MRSSHPPKDVFVHLKLFPSAVDEANGHQQLYGDAALKHLWAIVQGKMSSKTNVGLNDLEIFQTFKFMLSAEEVKTLSKWVCELLKDQADVGAHTAAGSSSMTWPSSAKAKAKGAAKAPLHTSKANIMALFGKGV